MTDKQEAKDPARNVATAFKAKTALNLASSRPGAGIAQLT